MYLSSVICTATIYLQSFDSPTITQNRPYFLREYSITIDRESVNKSVPLIKVDAVSRNPNNFMPINYKILNDVENYFVIDSFEFIKSNFNALNSKIQSENLSFMSFANQFDFKEFYSFFLNKRLKKLAQTKLI